MKRIIRTGLLTLAISAFVLLGWWYIMHDMKDRRIAELEALKAEMEARLAEKEAQIARLGREHRIAHFEVLRQELDALGEPIRTTVRLIEIDDKGAEIARQEFTIPGGVLFVDTWTAKFNKEDVALGHPMRGRTLVLLRRIYSEEMAPRDGFAIDTPGAVPVGYAVSPGAIFEKRIWEQFWAIATDPDAAARAGVRVAQGEVVYKPVREGQRFEFAVDAAGGINLRPLAEAPARASAD